MIYMELKIVDKEIYPLHGVGPDHIDYGSNNHDGFSFHP